MTKKKISLSTDIKVRKNAVYAAMAVILGTMASILLLEAGLRIYDKYYCPSGKTFNEPLYSKKKIVAAVHNFVERQKLPVKKRFYIEFDPFLGWDNTPGKHKNPDKTKGFYSINSQKMRADREFALKPGADIKRAIFVGDSFTFGADVGDEDCWLYRLDQRLGEKIEVMNMSVNAYGTDQAFLKMKRQGLRFNPHVAVLGVFLDNVFRNVNILRSFLAPGTMAPLSKPRFILDKEKVLRIVNMPVIPLEELERTILNFSDSPLRKYEYFFDSSFYRDGIWTYSYVFRFINKQYEKKRRTFEYAMRPGSEPYEITVAIAAAFHEMALKKNIDPYVIIIPNKKHLFEFKKNFFWRDFLDELSRRGIKYLDLTPELFKAKKDNLLSMKDLYDNHFTALASDIVAGIVHEFFTREKTFESIQYSLEQ